MLLTEDLDVFLADFGVPVVFTGSRAGLLGIEEFADQELLRGEDGASVTGRARIVIIPTADAADLKIDDPISVGGEWHEVGGIQAVHGATDYTVVSKQALDDGAFTMIQLQRA